MLLILASVPVSCNKEFLSPVSREPFLTHSEEGGIFTDSRDHKSYKMITIDSQTWMAENLSYIPYINNTQEGGIWVYDYADTSISSARLSQNFKSYGCLYNWETAENACPSGWHLPSITEWDQLINFVKKNGHYEDAGLALKSINGWMPGIGGKGTDDYGFDALPGGIRESSGSFHYIKGRTRFWVSTKRQSLYAGDTNYAIAYNIDHTTTIVAEYSQSMDNGLSVRCIKDVDKK